MSKEIKITMSDEVYGVLLSEMGIKKMCGNTHGVADELLLKIIATIEIGDNELNVEIKNRKT